MYAITVTLWVGEMWLAASALPREYWWLHKMPKKQLLALPAYYAEQDLCICQAFVPLSVPAWAHSSKPAAVRYQCSAAVVENAGSATLSAYVGSWTGICFISSWFYFTSLDLLKYNKRQKTSQHPATYVCILARCRLAYGPADATATHCLSLQ